MDVSCFNPIKSGILLVIVVLLSSQSLVEARTCRPLEPEKKAVLKTKFETWASSKKDKISVEELNKRRLTFEEHLNSCKSKEENFPADVPVDDSADKYLTELHDQDPLPPPVASPPLPPFPPKTQLSEDWQCIPDLTHRMAVFEHLKFPDSCSPGFEASHPWAFIDPYVPEGPELESTADNGGKMYNMLDLGAVLEGKIAAFVGDSIMSQLVDAMDCELSRLIGPKNPGSMTPYKTSMAMHAVGGTHPFGLPKRDSQNAVAGIFHRGDRQMDLKEIEKLLRNKEIDVLVYNFGLHYHDMDVYAQNMTWLVKRLEQWKDEGEGGKKRWVFFRDTSAQHFMGHASGDYDFRDKHRVPDKNSPDSKVTCACMPINPATHARDDGNRNTIMATILKDYPWIKWVEFFKTTAPRYNMHQENRMAMLNDHPTCDCSHFCYMPPYWQWVIHEIYIALRDGMKE